MAEDAKLVVYYNANYTPVLDAAGDALTHLNLAFAIPSASNPLTLEISGNLTSTLLGQVPQVQAAGKKVMLSFGGGTVSSAQYQAMVGNEPAIAAQLAAFVKQYGLDGIDVDYEDSGALMNNSGYNGGEFAITLTNSIHDALAGVGRGKLISHAPQPPYIAGPEYSGGWNVYATIWTETAGKIDWLNMQYYNNPGFNDADQVVAHYQTLLKGWSGFAGLKPKQLLVGKPIGQGDAGSGWIPAADIVSDIIDPLQAGGIGGAMGWQFSSDPTGSWQQTVGAPLGVTPPATV
ncbi:Glycosyl hydrolases family 18 [Tistlia consotensis]|uniref:chitinase n=1 Tax=Tistlia consotensis USBA 355 TaxID=560819 RepID=A0A1Y6BRI8_9PROT|nr:glycosyl hydrolase family 18 protein [Tistlia consotensis]SMF17211.1 Glycosyl hydrolases family 18 [Tistlia consotensis USBA 355]SNR40606.1 Glycosyl hydrolases family 18 [Tistlia consotensis]